MQGTVSGSPQIILRLEGLLVLIAGSLAFSRLDYGWTIYFLYFFAPDISLLGYVAGPKVGSIVYNLGHSYVIPVAVALAGFSLDAPILLAAGLIWISHIGFDRALGFGLKYPKGFGYTHLGLIGKSRGGA